MKTAKARKTSPRTIAIAAYEGVSLLDLGGPLEAFRIASSFGSGRATYECVVVSSRGGLVKTAVGIDIGTQSIFSRARIPIGIQIVTDAICVDAVTYSLYS